MQSGVLIIDKPAGLTSARVVGRVKQLLGAKRVGHAGTLDPFATGVLVCLINQATRLAQFFLTGDKQYVAELYLGVHTDTQDFTGQVIDRRPLKEISEADLHKVFSRFVGEIEQTPPAYSALKHKGVALYKLARKGRPVQKPARTIRIESLRIDSISLPTVRFSVTCSAGTYVRTLCADIGRALGCGGHLSALRRTVSSGFSVSEAVSMETLGRCMDEANGQVPLIPPGHALRTMPALRADQAVAAKIRSGRAIRMQDFTDLPIDATAMTNGDEGACFKILDDDENLIAVVSADPQGGKMAYHGVFL
jgi:tRNA pseudouridine55 synthase